MSKPEWKDSPEWANYLVQDREGVWVWFANEPEPFNYGANGYWRVGDDGGRFLIHNKLVENPSWEETMESRP